MLRMRSLSPYFWNGTKRSNCSMHFPSVGSALSGAAEEAPVACDLSSRLQESDVSVSAPSAATRAMNQDRAMGADSGAPHFAEQANWRRSLSAHGERAAVTMRMWRRTLVARAISSE